MIQWTEESVKSVLGVCNANILIDFKVLIMLSTEVLAENENALTSGKLGQIVDQRFMIWKESGKFDSSGVKILESKAEPILQKRRLINYLSVPLFLGEFHIGHALYFNGWFD